MPEVKGCKFLFFVKGWDSIGKCSQTKIERPGSFSN